MIGLLIKCYERMLVFFLFLSLQCAFEGQKALCKGLQAMFRGVCFDCDCSKNSSAMICVFSHVNESFLNLLKGNYKMYTHLDRLWEEVKEKYNSR